MNIFIPLHKLQLMVSCAHKSKLAAQVRTQMKLSAEYGAKTETCLQINVLFRRGGTSDECLATKLIYGSKSVNPTQPLEILSGCYYQLSFHSYNITVYFKVTQLGSRKFCMKSHAGLIQFYITSSLTSRSHSLLIYK